MRTFTYLFCLIMIFTGCTSVAPLNSTIQPQKSPSVSFESPVKSTETFPTPKIIHITDTHFGCHHDKRKKNRKHCKNAGALKDILNANDLASKNPSEYVVVFTGDAVYDAREYTDKGKYQKELDSYFKKLKENRFTILAVPGNHDYGSGEYKSAKSCAYNFKEYFGIEQNGAKQENEYKPYYETKNVNGIFETEAGNTVFFGLDSTEDNFANDKPDEGCSEASKKIKQGLIKTDKLDALKEALTSNKYQGKKKVVYLHHKPDSKLMKILKEYSNEGDNKLTVLIGHRHKNYEKHFKNNNLKLYNAGTSASYTNNEIRVIDLEHPEQSTTLKK